MPTKKKKAKKKKKTSAKATKKKTSIKTVEATVVKISSDKTCSNCNKTIEKGEKVFATKDEVIHIECKENCRDDISKRYLEHKYGESKAKKIIKEFEKLTESEVTKRGDSVTVKSPFNLSSSLITIKASSKDWEVLYRAMHLNKEVFANEIYRQFIEPAIKKIKVTPRGKHKRNTAIINEIKFKSAWLYCFVKYWIDNPDRSPCIFNTALHKLKQDESLREVPRHFFKMPKAITMFMIKEAYEKEIAEYELKAFNKIEIFYGTYIRKERNPYLKTTEETFSEYEERNTLGVPLNHIINIILKCL